MSACLQYLTGKSYRKFSETYTQSYTVIYIQYFTHGIITLVAARSVPPITLNCGLKSLNAQEHKTQTNLRFNFNKGNYNTLRKELDKINWVNVLSNNDVDSAVDVFNSVVNEIILKHIPLKSAIVIFTPIGFYLHFKKASLKRISTT